MTYLELIRPAEYKLDKGNITLGQYERIIELLNREIQPEIIRCKDCKYWRIDSEGERYCDRIVGVLGCDDGNGFCSDAEKRGQLE